MLSLAGCGATPSPAPAAPAPAPPPAVDAAAPSPPPAPSPAAGLSLACPGFPLDAAGDPDAGGAQGRIDPSPIRQAVSDHMGAVIACYERHSLPDPRSGRVSVRWVIAPDGRVARAEVTQDMLGAPAIARCLLEEVCTWTFPAPVRGSVTVTYPFIFDSPGL